MSVLIRTENLVTRFGDTLIHDKLNFSIKSGEVFGLLGGSGAGKSTLMRQMIMLEQFADGDLHILGKPLKGISTKAAQSLRLQWGVLFQFGALFSSLSVLENVVVPLKEYTSLDKEQMYSIAKAKLRMVGLPDRVIKLNPSELSGGMKKRVALARALVMDPKLLFLDEPTSGLDPASARAFDRLIVELKHMFGLTIVIVTHDLDTIKNALDRFIILYEKKILIEGDMEDVKSMNHPALDHFFTSH